MATARNSATPDPDKGRQEEPDAEQRLMCVNVSFIDPMVVLDADSRRFITDLDCWSIYALIATASWHQAGALRAAIYRHLTFEAFVGTTFPVSISSLKYCPKSIIGC